MLWSHAENHARAFGGGEAPWKLQLRVGQPRMVPGIAGGDVGRKKVHRGAADEAGDELVRRAVVNLERRTDLLHQAAVHDDDAITHGHRLHLVMGDVHHGGIQLLVEAHQLAAHGGA